jgi:diguanylate cyclase (GGDEF)-like protein/PAS domain S-box-containing protein
LLAVDVYTKDMISGSHSLIHLLRLIVMGCVVALSAASGVLFSTNLVLAILSFATAAGLGLLLWLHSAYEAASGVAQLSRLATSEADLNTVMEYALDAVVRMNSEGYITDWTGQAYTVFGWTRDEVMGRLLSDVIVPECHREAHAQGLARLLRTGQAHILNKRVEVDGLHRDGHEFPIELTISRLSSSGGVEFNAFVRDISKRREREKEWMLSETVFNTVDEAVMISDAENRIIRINPAFTQITGYASDEVLGKNPRFLSAGTHSPEFYQELWGTLKTSGSWRGEVKNRHKNGSFYIEWLSIKRLCDAKGGVIHYVAVFADISERKSAEAKVHRLAHHDPLTDLPNRTLLGDRLSQALATAQRERGQMALLFIDLDKFKPVNDTHGHHVGDLLLQEVARRLLDGARASDTVARLGGDEFVVLLPVISSEADALTVAKMIFNALEQTFVIGELRLKIDSSIGIALYPEHGLDEAMLLQNADSAMYQAKQQGGSAIVVYQPPVI